MLDFEAVVKRCLGMKSLVEQFDRLTGSNLSLSGTPLDLLIDEATGRTSEDLRLFTEFVYIAIWTPLLERQRNGS